MSPARRVAAAVVAVLVVVAAFLLGGDEPPPEPAEGGSPPESPALTPRASPTPSPRATPSPPSSATPSPPSSAAPSPPPSSPAPSPVPLVGGGAVDDPPGDVTDDAGVAAPGEPSAADLLEVRLEGTGDRLTATYVLGGPIPTEGESIVWSLVLWQDGAMAYSVNAEQVGGRLFTGVFDWETQQQEPVTDGAVLDGDTLRITVDTALLPRLRGSFEWFALTQRDGGYEDAAPDGRADALLPFPSS